MNFNWFKEPVPLDLDALKDADEALYECYRSGNMKQARVLFKRATLPEAVAIPLKEMLDPGIEGFLAPMVIMVTVIILLINFA